MFKCANLKLVDKFWISNMQYSSYCQQDHTINFKVTKRTNFNCSQHQRIINLIYDVLTNVSVVILQYVSI